MPGASGPVPAQRAVGPADPSRRTALGEETYGLSAFKGQRGLRDRVPQGPLFLSPTVGAAACAKPLQEPTHKVKMLVPWHNSVEISPAHQTPAQACAGSRVRVSRMQPQPQRTRGKVPAERGIEGSVESPKPWRDGVAFTDPS